MSSTNKRNIQYFEAATMADLHQKLQTWQIENDKRLLSMSVQMDAGKFCCIALTNPSEVVISSESGNFHANVSGDGCLLVRTA